MGQEEVTFSLELRSQSRSGEGLLDRKGDVDKMRWWAGMQQETGEETKEQGSIRVSKSIVESAQNTKGDAPNFGSYSFLKKVNLFVLIGG